MAQAVTASPAVRGPRGSWLTGNLAEFGGDPLGFLDRCAREYGDFVPIRLLNKRALIVNATEGIEDVLLTHHRSFTKVRGTRNPFTDGVFGNGLLTSNGSFWARQRKMVQPSFHRKRIAGYALLSVNLAEEMLAGWKPGRPVSVHHELVQLTAKVISRALFDLDVPQEIIDLENASIELMERMATPKSGWRVLTRFLPDSDARRLEGVLKALDALMYRLIAERRTTKADRGDILSMLVEARDEHGQGMTDHELRDELATLLGAGLDTTVLALSWSCYLLARHPAVSDEMEAELEDVLGGRKPTFEDLPALRYTEAVIKESMRLFPPAWIIVREAAEDRVIGGQPVSRGTKVLLSPWIKHRDERVFDRPEEFRPGRWLEAHEFPRFAYFPFGGGPRLCIGSAFAMMEAPLALATICRKYRFVCDPGYAVKPLPSLTLQPKGGLHLDIVPVR